MNQHNLFYYPYATFTNAQLPLLKVAALYFDKLYILDPVGASSSLSGSGPDTRKAIKLLVSAGILENTRSADILAKYALWMTNAIRQDLHDPEFLNLCQSQGRGQWLLSLAKVPQDLQIAST